MVGVRCRVAIEKDLEWRIQNRHNQTDAITTHRRPQQTPAVQAHFSDTESRDGRGRPTVNKRRRRPWTQRQANITRPSIRNESDASGFDSIDRALNQRRSRHSADGRRRRIASYYRHTSLADDDRRCMPFSEPRSFELAEVYLALSSSLSSVVFGKDVFSS